MRIITDERLQENTGEVAYKLCVALNAQEVTALAPMISAVALQDPVGCDSMIHYVISALVANYPWIAREALGERIIVNGATCVRCKTYYEYATAPDDPSTWKCFGCR